MSSRPRVAHTPLFIFDKIDGGQRDNTAGGKGQSAGMMWWGAGQVELRARSSE